MNISISSGCRRWSLVRSAALRSGLATMAAICSRDRCMYVVEVEVAVEELVDVTATMGGSAGCEAQAARPAASSAAGRARTGNRVMACLVEWLCGDVARAGCMPDRG